MCCTCHTVQYSQCGIAAVGWLLCVLTYSSLVIDGPVCTPDRPGQVRPIERRPGGCRDRNARQVYSTVRSRRTRRRTREDLPRSALSLGGDQCCSTLLYMYIYILYRPDMILPYGAIAMLCCHGCYAAWLNGQTAHRDRNGYTVHLCVHGHLTGSVCLSKKMLFGILVFCLFA